MAEVRSNNNIALKVEENVAHITRPLRGQQHGRAYVSVNHKKIIFRLELLQLN